MERIYNVDETTVKRSRCGVFNDVERTIILLKSVCVCVCVCIYNRAIVKYDINLA